MRSAISWLLLLSFAWALIILGFQGRVGSFLAAFVAPGALTASGTSGDGGPSVGGHCTPDGTTASDNQGNNLICSKGTWQHLAEF